MFATKPAFTLTDAYKILYNVGCMMDLPTGTYVRGMRGESIINGGLGALVAVVGKPNIFKSTIMHYMTLSAASKLAAAGIRPYINTYDTEVNIHLTRLLTFSKRFPEFRDIDIFDEGIWDVTDSTKHLGNEWHKLLKNFLLTEKLKNIKKYTMDTPFADRHGKPVSVMVPTFGQTDSLSKFVTSDVEEMQNKNELGDSGGNTIFMRQGLAKARLLLELPNLCNATAHYTICTAHVGTESSIGAQPHQVPTKKLQHMRMGEKIKGAPDDFFFLTNSLWQAVSSSLLNNQNTKGPEYPKTRTDVDEGSTDLNLVTFKLLRNKSGPSGYSIQIVVSQTEGVLPTLSEFHYIKENDRFGLEGNNVNYSLTLYPGVSLSRTTIREKIDTDPLLRRAIKITADILQIKELYKELPLEIPPLADLYKKLDEKYGWETLLKTRDFWTFDQYENEVPFLSALDMIEMYHDKYTPYWYKPSKATK